MTKPSSDSKPRTSESQLRALGGWVDRHALYFLAASVVGFVLSAVLHFSTYFITSSAEAWGLWGMLFIGSLLTGWAVLLMLYSRRRSEGVKEGLRRFLTFQRSSGHFARGVNRQVPRRGAILVGLVALHVFLTIIATEIQKGGDNPLFVNGRYVLETKERGTREVSLEVWRVKDSQKLRVASGGPMLFYAVCVLYLYYRPDEKYYQEYLQWRKKRGATGRRERGEQRQ